LFALIFASIWFLQIDATKLAQPGPSPGPASDAKRSFIEMLVSTGLVSESALEERGQSPALILENVNRLPCSSGAICEVHVRFATGDLLNFLIDRPTQDHARLVPVTPRAAELLAQSAFAQLVFTKSGSETHTVPIRRAKDGRWSVAREISTSDSDKSAKKTQEVGS
jgi:hypothetical protein